MRKPRLQDYGIEQEQIAAAEKWKWQDDSVSTKLSVGILIAATSGIALWLARGTASVEGYNIFGGVLLGGVVGLFFAAPILIIPSFLLGSIIMRAFRDPKAAEYRRILEAYTTYRAELGKYENFQLRQQVQFWTSLDGREFEIELGKLFSKLGYDVETTPASGDKGIDLLLSRGGQRTIVQCKRLSNPVGVAAVRELYGVMVHFRANNAILACTGGFTQGVVDFATGKPIKLMGLAEIMQMQASSATAGTQ